MARRTVAATAVAVVATAAAAAVAAGSSLPTAISREAAVLAETVRESTVIVLADSCDAACMEGVKARLAPRCSEVTILANIHMVSARCADASVTAAGDGPATPPPPSVADLLAGLPEVEATVPDSVVTVKAPAAVAPTSRQRGGGRNRFWGLDRINQFSLPLDGDSSTARCYPRRGAGVTVFVVDSGCTTSHPQFEGRATTQAGPGTPYPSGADDNSHGSHCAGTVGGRDTGVAPGVTLRCLKVLGADATGSTSGIIAAFNGVAGYKGNNPNEPVVLSASLGGSTRQGARDPSAIAASRAAQAGVVVVVAAGNDGGDACGVAPAASPDIITVANADRNDRLARSSNRGRCVDVIAPGTDILSVNGRSPRGALISYSGTSMACPHVAGMAALVLGEAGSRAGSLTTADVLARLTARSPRVGGFPMAWVGGTCAGGGEAPEQPSQPAPAPAEPPVTTPPQGPSPRVPQPSPPRRPRYRYRLVFRWNGEEWERRWVRVIVQEPRPSAGGWAGWYPWGAQRA